MSLLLASLAAVSLMGAQWTLQQAADWERREGWRVGCNFIPSTAINQLEMWQEESWDPKTIDRELGYAEGIGMSVVRVYLHDLAWEADPKGFESRMNEFLKIADKHKIKTLFVFFDDCWNPDPALGKQSEPKPSVHNSGWVRSPANGMRNWPKDLPRLQKYVTQVLNRFKADKRVWMWDLYNEPGNSGYDTASMDLLEKVFEWGRAVRPSQPLTVGVWYGHDRFNALQVSDSDIVSFHNYGGAAGLRQQITQLKGNGRPVVCTEWMARTNDSQASTHLAVFKEMGVSCINWGLVRGKTNTVWPWGTKEGAPEPDPWFHDLFWPDGKPYRQEEIDLFLSLTAKK